MLRLLLIAFALWFVGGASTAALACVSPDAQIANAAPMKSDCPDMPKQHDHSATCAPMCVAIPTQLVRVDPPRFDAEPVAQAAISFLPLDQIGPDPPPPRLG